jgi:hypothetical protein
MTQSNLPTLAESQGDICYSDEDYDKPYTARLVEKHKKLINGYLCEVEIDTDCDPSTEGWISKGSYSGSIACVLDQGYFTNASGSHQYEIPESILHRIEDWAYSVGY